MEDAQWVHHPHSDALVVKAKIGTTNIHRVFVDTGSSTDVLTYDIYKKMGFLDKDLSPTAGDLYGFTGNSIRIKGLIKLSITLGYEPCTATHVAEFTFVDQPCAYNAIIGRPILKIIKIVNYIHTLSMKFPTIHG
ncbi:uncharacterized protein LOC141692209 [Apium graveolens]|uniref:uncharacterized protein LOC141692209 n=1 Tax=Apium graveolens TaxID=4045 RepID=UPI003D7BFFB0